MITNLDKQPSARPAWLDEKQRELIHAYIQGAVYCWCKNRPEEAFAARDLFGGENFEWGGTPGFALYQHHEDAGVDDPVNEAGVDMGYLLKAVLHADWRNFEKTEKKPGPFGGVSTYRWVK